MNDLFSGQRPHPDELWCHIVLTLIQGDMRDGKGAIAHEANFFRKKYIQLIQTTEETTTPTQPTK